MIVLAHGVGNRADLPIPLWLALYAGALAVLASFLALVALWRTPRLGGPARGVPLPAVLQRIVDASVVRRGLQALTLAIALLVIYVGLTGRDDPGENLAPWVVYVTLWVGLVPASLLLGPVWRAVNPLRLLHRLLQPLVGDGPLADRLPALGYWPAVTFLVGFVWLELVYPQRATPMVVALFVLGYGVAQLIGALWFGAGWFARGDAFEVYSSLLGRLAPLGRRPDGRLALRNPLHGAATLRREPGLTAVVVVLVGSTAFDGLSRTAWWQAGPGVENDTLSGTLGLLACIGVVALLYVAGAALTGLLAHQRPGRQPVGYAHSVLPIAAGYAVAHYFSLLLLDGQQTWILASNPLRLDGVDLFGTAGDVVNYTLVGTDTIAYVQVGAVIVGHVLGVVLAHDHALTRSAPTVAQLPLVAVMIIFTVGGLALLFGL